MADKEKVITHLNDMRLLADIRIHPIVSPENWNVYSDLCDLIDAVNEDVLVLLKEQEARVLDIDEFKNFAVVWFEARNHLYIEPMLTRGKTFADASTDWFRYGKEWRCWTSKPTEEQRKAVKWDD